MKANELMCDDLVLKDGKPIRIYGIMERMERVYDTMTNDVSLKHIAPIPLTAEILEKNGFVRSCVGWIGKIYGAWDISVYLSEYAQIEITNYCGRGTDCVEVNYGSTIEFDHNISVHELQHALRLCGLTELADNFQLPELPKEDTK